MLGYIPDHPYLYEKLTPVEFLRFVGRLWQMQSREVEARTRDYLERFELWDRRNELIEALSHGMRQKVVIAAAFLHDPKLIVVDEPMVGLDPRAARTVKSMFVEHAQRGGAVFLSTHDLGVAQELCHRVAIIHRSRLVAVGTMPQLQRMAVAGERGLEDIFLTLTGEESRRSDGGDRSPQ